MKNNVNIHETDGGSVTVALPGGLDALASDLRRIRPTITDRGTNNRVSLLIGQCERWEHGNRAAMRKSMEDNIQEIETEIKNSRMARQGE